MALHTNHRFDPACLNSRFKMMTIGRTSVSEAYPDLAFKFRTYTQSVEGTTKRTLDISSLDDDIMTTRNISGEYHQSA
jgi:hypothetical protein